MAGVVSAFLREIAGRPFVYGETDCALILGEWWRRVHGADPAAALRGAYSDEEGCAALLARNGHLPRLVARLARSVGARRTNDPQPGDFAVIRHAGRWWGAIRTEGGWWAIKAGPGLFAARRARVVAAWSIGCPVH